MAVVAVVPAAAGRGTNKRHEADFHLILYVFAYDRIRSLYFLSATYTRLSLLLQFIKKSQCREKAAARSPRSK